MKRPASTPAVKPKTLSQQNSDFTSEGSPPPGHVAGATDSGPALPDAKTDRRTPTRAPSTPRR